MSDIPVSTVTFLFTDVEGSAALWGANPARMGANLARYDRIVRDAVGNHRGHVFKTVGDACYAAFDRPEDALRAALEAQRKLFTEEWSVSSDRPRVRMALHTGAAEERADGYSGSSVNRVERLLSVGNGGQVLLSGATYDLVGDHPELVDAQACFDDLGPYRLAARADPEHIFQIYVPDLPYRFRSVLTRETPGDSYRVLKLLGDGGMANVFLARDEHLGRDVALKMMHSMHTNDPVFGELFLNEARCAAKLSHTNIVSIHALVRNTGDDTPYIDMEYVPGGTLKDLIRREGPLPPRRSASIAIQIATALGYAHEHGVIHRDVKPDNVLLTRSGDIKVADFGIARAAFATSRTRSDFIMGSAPYMSPEQVMGRDVDRRSDLYSLGIVLYEMLTGTLPYDEEDPMATALLHEHGELLEPKEVDPDVPDRMNDITVRLLARDPEKRHQDASALVDDLKTMLSRPPKDYDGTLTAERSPSSGVAEEPAAVAIADEVAPPLTVEVPNLVGDTALQASSTLAAVGLTLGDQEADPGETAPEGDIIGQSPEAETEAEAGSLVSVTVSSGLREKATTVLDTPQTLPTESEAREEGDERGGRRRSRNPILLLLLFLLLLALLGGTVYAVVQWAILKEAPDLVEVGSIEEAQGISGEDFEVVVGERVESKEPIGAVVGQDLEAGETARRGSTIYVDVSDGIPIPDLVGQTEDEAEQSIGEDFEIVKSEEDSDKPKGTILSQDLKPDERSQRGSTISVVVSAGIFQDDFSDPSTGWTRQPNVDNVDKYGFFSDYANGGYRIYDVRPHFTQTVTAPIGGGPDVIVEVDASSAPRSVPSALSPAGVVCRLTPTNYGINAYFMGLRGDGSSQIAMDKNGRFIPLANDFRSAAVLNGEATNRIRGECVGSTLTLYVNDQKLLEVENAELDSGDVGLFVVGDRGEPSSHDVLYDNFSVSNP